MIGTTLYNTPRAIYLTVVLAPLLLLFGCSSNPDKDTRQQVVAPDGYTSILITLKNNGHSEQAIRYAMGRHYTPKTGYASSMIVRRQVNAIAREYRLIEQKGWQINSLSVYCAMLGVPNTQPLNSVIKRLQKDKRIESVQPLIDYTTQAVTNNVTDSKAPYNDPYFDTQYRGPQKQQVAQLHRLGRGNGVKVAIIDTGADIHHPELQKQIDQVSNFVDKDDQRFRTDIHGTAVAGIIAARPNNEQGIVGLSPAAKVLMLKACWQLRSTDSRARCNSFTIASAISHAIDNRVDIINLSLAGPPDPLVSRLVGEALNRGIIVVAADPGTGPRYPAQLPGVIGVRPLLPGDTATEGGKTLALHLSGDDILTTTPNGGFDFFSGTSMSTAMVSALSALMVEQHPGITPNQLFDLIEDMAIIRNNQTP